MADDEDQHRSTLEELTAWRDEPLLPELEPYLEESEFLGKILRHPLVYSIPFSLPGLVNKQFRAKKTALERYRAKGDWHTVIFLHERPYRPETLYQVMLDNTMHSDAPEIGPEEYWQLVRSVWVDTENAGHMGDVWTALLEEFWPGDHQHMMDDEEKAYLNSLTEPITIYRGCVEGINEDGLSWTLDRGRAMWFALRFDEIKEGGIPVVLKTEVSRSDIVAYLTGRNEEEILLFPETVRNLEYDIERIKRARERGTSE